MTGVRECSRCGNELAQTFARKVEEGLVITDLRDMHAFYREGRIGEVLRRTVNFIEKCDYFPNYKEKRNFMSNEVQRVEIVSRSNTYVHGHIKVIVHTSNVSGKEETTVKVIDTRPVQRGGNNASVGPWSGTMPEFREMMGSLMALGQALGEP